jgi:hypothetical protein
VLGSQTDLHLAGFFPESVFGLFLKLASQKFARSGQAADRT